MTHLETLTNLKGRRAAALGTTALSLLLLGSTGAFAASPAVAAPAAGSLPGSFSSNSTVGYTNSSATTATIADTGAGNTVLQWGGAALSNKVTAPNGITTNSGFSIGSGATLKITSTGTSVLVNDLTGSPSQIYGTLNAAGVAGPLYVANSSGVIVGSTGVISAPGGGTGVGLIGYSVDSTAFAGAGTLSVNNTTSGAGDVTVQSGATINGGGGPLLVASNGTVNIAAVATGGATNNIVAGWGFTTGAGSVTPTPAAAALTSGGNSVVNFTPAANNVTMAVDSLNAGGAVNNSANLTFVSGGGFSVTGMFTNNGVLNETAALGGGQLAGGLTNNGVLNELAPTGLMLRTNGNFSSKGVLNLAGVGSIIISGANVDLEGQIEIAGKATSTTNQLGGVALSTLTSTNPQAGGVVDLATSLFSNSTVAVAGNAIRILSGGIFADGVRLRPGTKASAVADPFYGLTALNYTMSVFPGATVQSPAGTISILNPSGGTSFTTTPGVNLDGTLSAPTVVIAANNINGTGGIDVPNGGAVSLTFYGNVNNPNGAAANHSTAFQYNGLPVTVGANGTKPGTATIQLSGPSDTSGTVQLVNLLVNGNVNLADRPMVAPTLPTAVVSPYTNNHLVVQATGNINLDSANHVVTTFYWPGFVYLASGVSATNPTAAPNSTASISLGDTAGNVTLENLLPADLTTADVAGQIGHGGIYLETNNLNLTPSNAGTASVITSNNSWVHFLTPTLATSFSTVSGASFLAGTITSNVVTTSKLPASDFVSP